MLVLIYRELYGDGGEKMLHSIDFTVELLTITKLHTKINKPKG